MLAMVLGSSFIIVYLTTLLVNRQFRKSTFEQTIKKTDNQAAKVAIELKTISDQPCVDASSLAAIFQGVMDQPFEQNAAFFSSSLQSFCEKNSAYLCTWYCLEMNYVDNNWSLPYGRQLVRFERNAMGIDQFTSKLDTEEEDFSSAYYSCKKKPELTVLNPVYAENNSKELIASILAPIVHNGKFMGVVGIDYRLNSIKAMFDSINSVHESKLFLLSFNGDVVCNPKKTSGINNIVEVDTFLSQKIGIISKIQSGQQAGFFLKDKNNKDSIYYALATFLPGETKNPWGVLIKAPLATIDKEISQITMFVRRATTFGMLILAVIVLFFTLQIVFPLQRITKIMLQLSLGKAGNDLKLKIRSNDELGEMADSVNKIIDGMAEVTAFAENIGKGNSSYQFNPLSQDDKLGNAIIEMRNSLVQATAEEEQRRVEEEQLNWASNGINLFNNVLRVDNQNLELLSTEIIKTLALYLNAHMGGLYVKADEKNYVELVSFIGYSKQKYSKRIIEPGDGLIGRAVLEKETIFINDIPKDTDPIGSGLGRSKPVSILVVPLLNNKEIVGVIELASLKNIEPYQISFVEKIVETIASTIATVKVNVRTAKLLEKSRRQAEELEQQEEEMRQNMEEMQATQEEASKRELELSALIQAFQSTIPIIEYDNRGKIIDANDELLRILKIRKSQLIGKYHKADLFMNEQEQLKHAEFWENIRKGIIVESVEFIKSGKDDYWFNERFVPVRDASGIISKVMAFAIDITEQKKTESQIQQVQEGHLPMELSKKGKQKQKRVSTVDINQNLELIDLTYLKMVYKKDAQKIYNILKLYFDSLPHQMTELNEVLKKRDYKTLKVKASSLKTKMSYLGLKQVYEQLGNIERIIADDKNLVEIPKLLQIINEQWSKAYVELSGILNAKS
jgi:methyl-accepting chemotaxis protein